jgi:hypothetical protein
MIMRSIPVSTLAAWVCCHSARAADIEGAWATDVAACSKIYVRSGGEQCSLFPVGRLC